MHIESSKKQELKQERRHEGRQAQFAQAPSESCSTRCMLSLQKTAIRVVSRRVTPSNSDLGAVETVRRIFRAPRDCQRGGMTSPLHPLQILDEAPRNAVQLISS